MSQDDFQKAWQAQPPAGRPLVDAEFLLREVQRNQQNFSRTIFWRDLREIGIGIVMIPVWIYLGMRVHLPWTWYLCVPYLVYVVGCFAYERLRARRQAPVVGEPLRQRVESALADVEHQVRLLRNVFWWYIFPAIPPMLAFFFHVCWLDRSAGWLSVLVFVLLSTTVGFMLFGVYLVNLHAVQSSLEPRRQELKTLLEALQDDAPG